MENSYFYCYSIKLKDFLKSQGLRFTTKGLHPKSGKPFFVFEKSQKLDVSIEKWNSLKV